MDEETAERVARLIARYRREATRIEREDLTRDERRRDAWAREVARHMFGLARRRGQG